MAINKIPKPTTSPRTLPATNLFPSPKTKTKTKNTNHHLSPPPTPSRTLFSEAMMQENIENAATIIRKWNPHSSNTHEFTSLFQEHKQEAREFVLGVQSLRKTMHFLISKHPNSEKLVLANKLMKIAMSRLEKEFHHILTSYKDEYVNPDSDSSRSSRLSLSPQSSEDEDGISPKGISDLKLIADAMISSGYSKECVKIYGTVRKSILDEELMRIGIGSSQTIDRMDSERFEQEVKKWKLVARIAVRNLFRGERFLCDYIFAASQTIQQTCFARVIKDGAVNLFRFPENVAKSKRSPEKILPLINLYEAVSGLRPDIESIFSYEQLSSVKVQAFSTIYKLSESIETIISEFVSSVQKNSVKTPVPGGGIHPLTYSVMDFVSVIAENTTVLSDILTQNTQSPPFPPESYFESPGPTSAVASRVAWIVLVLLCKLDVKAEVYNDVALSYLFLANNIQFVVDKVETSSSLKFLLGKEWLSKLQSKRRIYAGKYEAVGWGKVFSFLAIENSVEELSPEGVRERIGNFNSAFEEACRKQRSWVVPNSKLRDEIKVSIARKLVPAYREFYDVYLAMMSVSGGKNLEVPVRLSPDNLGNWLSDLFHSTVEVSFSGGSISRHGISRCL